MRREVCESKLTSFKSLPERFKKLKEHADPSERWGLSKIENDPDFEKATENMTQGQFISCLSSLGRITEDNFRKSRLREPYETLMCDNNFDARNAFLASSVVNTTGRSEETKKYLVTQLFNNRTYAEIKI